MSTVCLLHDYGTPTYEQALDQEAFKQLASVALRERKK